jgi:outer membrane lipoprotein-sorting protein
VSRIALYAAVVLLICCSAWTAPADASADDILAAVDSIRAPGTGFMFDVTLVSRPKGKNPVIQKFTVSVKDRTKSLVRFTAPPENRGRVLLMVGQNLWIHIPSTNQAIRISPQQRLLGQVANGDVARVVYSYDYTPALRGTDILNGLSSKVLELAAKTPEATYGKIILWVASSDSRPIKAEFYASSGKLLKTAMYTGYQRILSKDRPMRIEIADEVRKGDISTLDFTKLRLVDLPESEYEKDNLKYIH